MYSPSIDLSHRAPGVRVEPRERWIVEELLSPLSVSTLTANETELLRREFADVRDDVRRLMEHAESRDGEPLEPGEVQGVIRAAFRASRLADTPRGWVLAARLARTEAERAL